MSQCTCLFDGQKHSAECVTMRGYSHSPACIATGAEVVECVMKGCRVLPDEEHPGGCRHTADDNAGTCGACLWERCKDAEKRLTVMSVQLKEAAQKEERLRKEYLPIPMLIWCPMCHDRHYDEGDFATKPHHTHACQTCGHTWRASIVPTVGVRFLPGFKNP